MSVLFHEFMRVQVFACGFTPPNQKQMIHTKAERIRPAEETINGHGKRNPPFIDGFAKRCAIARSPDENVREGSSEKKEAQQSCRTHKDEEVAVVAATHAVVEPNTVMVLSFNAVVADTTVMRARRSPYVAAFAILGGNFHCSVGTGGRHNHCPLRSSGTKTQWVFIRIRGWERVQIAGEYLAKLVIVH
jgi:hypothetical protein